MKRAKVKKRKIVKVKKSKHKTNLFEVSISLLFIVLGCVGGVFTFLQSWFPGQFLLIGGAFILVCIGIGILGAESYEPDKKINTVHNPFTSPYPERNKGYSGSYASKKVKDNKPTDKLNELAELDKKIASDKQRRAVLYLETKRYISPTYRGGIKQAVKIRLKQKYGYRCAECDKHMIDDGVELDIDHIIPLDMGGLDTEDNMQVLCSHCNRSKGARRI